MRALTLLPAVALLLTACGSSPEPGDPRQAQREIDDRAEDIARSWPDVREQWNEELVLLDNPVTWIADDELPDNAAAAFASGWYRDDLTLPKDSPGETIDYGGGTETVTVWSAERAHEKLTGNSPPDGCDEPEPDATSAEDDEDSVSTTAPCGELRLTDMSAGTDTRWSNHGMVEVPVWRYEVSGFDAPISQLAFDIGEDESTVEVDVSAMTPLDEAIPARQLVAVDDTRLEYTVTSGGCSTNERPVFAETDDLVVVGGVNDHSGANVCTGDDGAAPVDVTLRSEIGERMVVDADSGTVLTHRGPFPRPPNNY